MKKLTRILVAAILSISFASANDVMQKSMATMDDGMNLIQKGFMNNNVDLIKEGLKKVEKGNDMFSDSKTIAKYLPDNKKHMVNVAVNQSKRIKLDATVIDLRLDDKAYVNAANGYSDMLNACSRCHGLVRNW